MAGYTALMLLVGVTIVLMLALAVNMCLMLVLIVRWF